MRSRDQWVLEEKGQFRNHFTISELAKSLGLTTRTIQRRVAAGVIPQPAQRTSSGWGLWSPAQQTALLRKEARLDK